MWFRHLPTGRCLACRHRRRLFWICPGKDEGYCRECWSRLKAVLKSFSFPMEVLEIE